MIDGVGGDAVRLSVGRRSFELLVRRRSPCGAGSRSIGLNVCTSSSRGGNQARLVRSASDDRMAPDEPRSHWRELDGTMAFVDISGFTAMSERLAGLGKAGAEEVTDVMNTTFAAPARDRVLLRRRPAQVRRRRAAAPLHRATTTPRRAARAAFGMRRRLRAIGRPATSAGVGRRCACTSASTAASSTSSSSATRTASCS